MCWTSPAPSDAFRTDARWLTRNLEEWGPGWMQGWHLRTHTWIFNAEYFRGFAVASWKAKRVAKESKFWIQVQIPPLSFLCTQSCFGQTCPTYMIHTPVKNASSSRAVKLPSVRATFQHPHMAERCKTPSLWGAFKLPRLIWGSFQDWFYRSYPLVFAVVGWVHKQFGNMGHSKPP